MLTLKQDFARKVLFLYAANTELMVYVFLI